jgi:hypothetical protein
LKLATFSLAWLTMAAAAASGQSVPMEFRGTWVFSAAACSHKEGARLLISEDAVESAGSHGFVNAVTTLKPKSIEVIFRQPGQRVTSRNVFTFTLSPDGTKLLQMRGNEVAATRIRCESVSR